MWIANEGLAKPERKPLTHVNTAEHPRHPSAEVKMDAIHRCFDLGESVKSVSKDIGYIRASIYSWRTSNGFSIRKGEYSLLRVSNSFSCW